MGIIHLYTYYPNAPATSFTPFLIYFTKFMITGGLLREYKFFRCTEYINTKFPTTLEVRTILTMTKTSLFLVKED